MSKIKCPVMEGEESINNIACKSEYCFASYNSGYEDANDVLLDNVLELISAHDFSAYAGTDTDAVKSLVKKIKSLREGKG